MVKFSAVFTFLKLFCSPDDHTTKMSYKKNSDLLEKQFVASYINFTFLLKPCACTNKKVFKVLFMRLFGAVLIALEELYISPIFHIH